MKVKAEAKRDGYMYRCVVKDSQGNTATSDGAKLTVFGITTQPKNVQAKLDSTAKFTVAAKGAGLTYQWQLSANGGSSWSNSTASGYNTATIKVKAEAKRDGYMYRCIVKDSSGNEMTSNAAKLTVFRIVTQPKNTEAARDGDTVTVTVKASGEGLTYQWYYKDKNQTAFTKTTVSTPSYSVKVTSAVNGRQVYCVVTDKNGSSITSNTVTLTISKDAPIAYGKCGDNAEWELKKDGTLKIIGTGKVYHWNTSTPAPWDEYKDQILKAEIGDGITWLESYMFYNCSKLTSVTISDTVTTINGYAFNACASLERIELPASVSSIKSYAFYECPKLSFISVDKANKNYLNDTYGVVYSKDKTVLVVAPPTLSGKYTVTSTVNTIAASAFRGCASLTEISLPSGLTALGERTFFGCSSLASIVIPSGVTALPLGVFASCTSLKSITIPNNVTELGNYAFKDCTSLNSVSMSSKAVNWGTGVFYKCSALKNVFIPSGVTEIKANTFYGCKSLVFEDIPSSVTTIGDKAFNGCSSLRDIRFKGNAPKLGTDSFAGVTADCYYPSSNTSWTNSVRSGFGSKLTWYTCKEGGSAGGGTHWVVTSDNALIIYGVGAMPWVNLGEHPWDKYISSLVSFTAKEGVTSISSYTCYYGINVQSIKLPKGLKEIQFGAFEDCRKVTSITLPTSLTTIGELSFVNCSGLKTVTIPASVTKLGAGAFADCSSLTSFKVNTSNKTYVSDSSGVVYTKDKTVIVAVPAALSGTYKILSTVTKINDYAFSGCSKLTSISIPESVTQIGKYGIRRCSGLTSITLPSGLTGIGYSAFATCTGLTTITIPSGVTKLEGNTFHYCTNLAEIKLPSKLKTISDYTFQGCSKLKSIVIPAKVTSVGDSAFYKCSALTVIRFKGNAPTFDKNAFATIKATVKYPSSATGWTKEVRQNYGGTITWLAV